MADPPLSVVLGGAFFLGVDPHAALAGFFGSLTALSYLEAMGPWRRIWVLSTSTLTATYTSPMAQVYLASLLETPVAGDKMLYATAFMVGAFAQTIVPALIATIRRKAGLT